MANYEALTGLVVKGLIII